MKKKVIISLSVVVLAVCLACVIYFNNKGTTYEMKVRIPAGSTEAFVCSDEEFSPAKDNVTLSCGQGLEETEVFFETVEVKEKNAYSNIKLTADKPVNTYIEKGGWFKISVAVQNPTDEDIEVGVIIDNVRAVRIE
ncbi:MAG: hypothetical protein E7262_06715 [Lachnospiraceae bacterium]|nr:hypothetical protein [Lachnospiraceae bacterium]